MKQTSQVGLTGLMVLFLVVLVLHLPNLAANEPVTIAVGDIQSLGGNQGFCPSERVRQELIHKLSSNSVYSVKVDMPPSAITAVLITGSVNCSLEKKLRQRGIPLFQEQFTLTTAKVNVQLKLINPTTGTIIATPVAQAQAQSETQALSTSVSRVVPLEGETLFPQAISLALDKVVLEMQTPLTKVSQ